MRFEEIVEKLYEKFVDVVEKEKKIERVKEIAKELGFEIENIEFNPSTEAAYAIIDIDNDKLNEILDWLLSGFRVTEVKILINVGGTPEAERVAESTQKRAEEIGLKYIGYKELGEREYVDCFEISEDVYLLVYNVEGS